MCDGGEAGPRACPDANDVKCARCGLVRTVDDTRAPGKCPECGHMLYMVNRCAHCPLDDLDHARLHSDAGRLLDRILELEFAAATFAIPWTDVTAEEGLGMKILKEERARYQVERAKAPNGA